MPILEKAIEAYKLWHSFLPSFAKTSRYTLGEKIDAHILALIEHILKATYAARAEKGKHITEASVSLDMIKLFLKIAWELKLLDHKNFARLSEALVAIGNMLGGWQRYSANAPEGRHV